MITLLLWSRFVLLLAIVAVVGCYVWAGLEERE